MNKKIRVGIIGCGTIGKEIVAYCMSSLKNRATITAIFDIDKEKLRGFEKSFSANVRVDSVDKVFGKSDLIIEAAQGAVSASLLRRAISRKKDIMIMSIGGLLGHEGLLKKAAQAGIKVYLPSGAIAGLDALKAAVLSGIYSVTLITRKPPKGLKGASYLLKKKIRLDGIKKEKVVFSGTAENAVKAFPKNINVSAILSLAGIGARRTRVKIIACPGSVKNIHEIVVKGKFGVLKSVTENIPSPENPKTSYLAALSAIATLRGIVDSIQIGT